MTVRKSFVCAFFCAIAFAVFVSSSSVVALGSQPAPLHKSPRLFIRVTSSASSKGGLSALSALLHSNSDTDSVNALPYVLDVSLTDSEREEAVSIIRSLQAKHASIVVTATFDYEFTHVSLYSVTNGTAANASTVAPKEYQVAEWSIGVMLSVTLILVIAAVAFAVGGMSYTNDTLLFRYSNSL
eukprot:ANDGO_04355.mRNA.1 hypothetical protein